MHILKYISLFGGVQVLNVLIGIVRNKCVAMLLGPQGVGLISLFNSSTRLIGDATNFGIPMSAVRNLAEDYDQGDEEKLTADIAVVRSWSLLTALLGLFYLRCSQSAAKSLHLLMGRPHASFRTALALCCTDSISRRRTGHP